MPIGTPKNVPGAHANMLYKGTAPMLITTKLEDLERLRQYAEINPATGCPWDAEASMIWRRLKVYRFTKKASKPRQKLQYCPRCFCHMLNTFSVTSGRH